MQASKKLGIWLDHASARLTEFAPGPMTTTVIESKFSHQTKTESLAKSEHGAHEKEQQLQGDFYKKLGDEIKNYESVIIFGPTDAKSELANFLKKDHHFDGIKIEVEAAMQMSEKQEQAFVRDHFSQM